MEYTIETLGLIGGNLLAAMLAFEAKKRGIKTILLEPELKNIAGDYVDKHIVSKVEADAIERLALRTDCIIFCTGNMTGQTPHNTQVPVMNQKILKDLISYPNGVGLELVGNQIQQLLTAQLSGIPTANFFTLATQVELIETIPTLSLPVKIYAVCQDHYKLYTIENLDDVEILLNETLKDYQEWVVEEINEYDRILSISTLVTEGKVYTYPLQEEALKESDVKYIHMPAPVTVTMEKRIIRYVKKLLKEQEYEGLYTFKFGIKKNKGLELIYINPGISVGDIATLHYTDLSIYEQYFNLIEGKAMKNGELEKNSIVTVVKNKDQAHQPLFPYHQYIFDKDNTLPVSIYVKAEEVDKQKD